VPALLIGAAERVERLMRDFDAASVEDVFSEGLLNVMAAPEFADSGKLRRVFGMLENRDYMGRLLDRVSSRPDVQVLIGGETGRREMEDVSLILAAYGRPGRAMGVVGVLGPTRMAYAQAIGRGAPRAAWRKNWWSNCTDEHQGSGQAPDARRRTDRGARHVAGHTAG
jgi:heat-inducible transcriptional repressor